jgi:hypothetical protein
MFAVQQWLIFSTRLFCHPHIAFWDTGALRSGAPVRLKTAIQDHKSLQFTAVFEIRETAINGRDRQKEITCCSTKSDRRSIIAIRFNQMEGEQSCYR